MLLHQRANHDDQKQKPQSIDMCAMTSQCETGGLTRTFHSIIYPAEGKKKLLEQAAF